MNLWRGILIVLLVIVILGAATGGVSVSASAGSVPQSYSVKNIAGSLVQGTADVVSGASGIVSGSLSNIAGQIQNL